MWALQRGVSDDVHPKVDVYLGRTVQHKTVGNGNSEYITSCNSHDRSEIPTKDLVSGRSRLRARRMWRHQQFISIFLVAVVYESL
jgi:hypothetical protein